MILYFTGTGNGRYIAEKIAEATSDELLSINEKIKTNDSTNIAINGNLIFVLPTYSWRIPRIVENWIRTVNFINAEKVYFVMHCGSEIANAEKYNKKLSADKGFQYMGTTQIIMPENYIALFQTPKTDEARKILAAAEPKIQSVIESIINATELSECPKRLLYPILSGFVNKIFYPLFVKAKKFYTTDKCISCGRCAKLCPLNNIKLVDGKPQWNGNCTHCMACISYCPTEAIEYGNKTKNQFRYTIDKVIKKEH